MKLVYAVDKNGYDDADHVGVRKKVEAVLRLFEKEGIHVTLYKYEWQGGFPMLSVDDDTDVLYFRRIEPSVKLLLKLRELKKTNKKIRLIMEIPTYPFSGESTAKLPIKRRVSYTIGNCLLRFFLDRIVLIGQEHPIPHLYGVPVIHAKNGVDYEEISLRTNTKKENEIHMIAVSGCYFWHGYDRLIKGLANYYAEEAVDCQVYFHLVGEGKCLAEYKQLAQEGGLLDKYVFFHGRLVGQELDEVYNMCDVAIDCLGCHRKQLYYVSSLKVREYAAKGLPMVTSTIVDINCKELSEYILELSPDETDIDVERIIRFTDSVYEHTVNQAESIRETFRPYCEWKYSFKNVVKYLKEE